MARRVFGGCAVLFGMLHGCGASDETDGASAGRGGAAATGGASMGGSAGAGGSGATAGGSGTAGNASGGTSGSGGASGSGGTSGSDGAGGAAGANASGGASGSAGASAAGGASGSGGTGASGGSAGSAGVGGSAGTGGSAGGGTEIDFDPTSIPQSNTAFPLGIQSGDPTDSSAVIWTHHAGTEPLVARVYVPTAPGKALVFHDSTPQPDANGYVHVDAAGLPPLTDLSYVFLEDQGASFVARSPIGRLVTAAAPGHKVTVRFGGVSCTSNSRAPFEPLPRGGALNLDFFILAGDTTYNDSATTLDAYRQLWRNQIGEGTYQQLLQSTAHYATWDDHELDNDWDPETMSPSRLAFAHQTFFEHLPIRRDSTDQNRIWRSQRWGDTLEVFVLDSRSERKPSTRTGPNAEYLSTAQLAWLKGALKASPAVFKVIVSSVPITNFPGLFDVAVADRWEGYPAQRTELLDYLVQEPIKGVLFVSGDFHLGSAGTVEPSGPHAVLREVLMGPGDQNANPLASFLPGAPQFDYRSGTSNVTTFEANPNATPPSIKVTFVGGNGSTLYEKVYTF